MKKIFKLVLVLAVFCMFSATGVFAANVTGYIPNKIIVKFDKNFSSSNPPKTLVVEANDNYNFKSFRPIEKGTKVYLTITKVNKEKIGDIDATVEAKVEKIYIPSLDKTIEVTNPNAVIKISKYEKLDIKSKSVDAGISVAGMFVDNITYPAHFVKGVVENKDGNRLKSGAKEVYESSALKYTGKGEALVLKEGGLATFTFYTKNITTEELKADVEKADVEKADVEKADVEKTEETTPQEK